MPHFVLECSESILGLADPNELMQCVYSAAESTELFALSGVGGIKVRIKPFKYFINVDAHKHFVHVFANIMEGRSCEQKKLLSETVVRSIKTLLPSVAIISMNVRDFEKSTYCNAQMIQQDGIAS